jgi:hypothetical protein
LPFCQIFTSGDRLHQRITPLFLREDQEFVWAPGLKADLGRLDAHYDGLPESVKAQGIMRFALQPPTEGDFLTAKLWEGLRRSGASPAFLRRTQRRRRHKLMQRRFPTDNNCVGVRDG